MKVAFNISIFISTLFYAYFILSIVLFNHYRESARLVRKGPQPFELILIIPVLNEAEIIGKTVTALTRELDQLPTTIQAQIVAVDDNSSDDSLQVLTSSKSSYLKIIHRSGHAHHGKGAVINTAIQYLQQSLVKDIDPDKTVIGILDADAFMSSQGFTEVIARFEQQPKMSMLQTGVSIYNQTNWLTRMQDFEFITWYGSIQSQFLKPSAIWLALLFTVLLIGFIVGLTYFLSQRRTSTSWLIGTFIVLTLLKFPLTALVKIVPTSDFWSYQELAALSANGMTWHTMLQHNFLGLYLIFPHALNVANFFSLGNTFFGNNFFVDQIINISATFLDMLLLYWIGARWLNRKMGILAALVFYAIPAYWIYSTLLDGAEPLMITMWLLAMLALTKVLKPLSTAGCNDQWVNLVIGGVATLGAYMLRPNVLVWPVVLIIMLIALALQVHPKQSQPLRKLGYFIGLILVLMISTPLLYSWMYGIDLSDSDGVDYSLATGTDTKTDGQYSLQISDQVIHELQNSKSLAKAYPDVASNLDQTTRHNLQTMISAGELPGFINNKMRVLMSEDYGFDWTTYNLSHSRAQRPSNNRRYNHRTVLLLLSFGYFDLLLMLAFLSVLIALVRLAIGRQRLTNHFFYNALLLDGLVIETLLFEVQGRYHIIFYLPLVGLVVTGVNASLPWVKRKFIATYKGGGIL